MRQTELGSTSCKSEFTFSQHQFPFYCFPLILCIDHGGRLSYLSLLFFGTVHSNGYIFPYFLQFKSEFGNKKFMIWATVSSQSCFCWLYRTSPSLAAKNIINLILVLTIWWCPYLESSLMLLEEGVSSDQCIIRPFSNPKPGYFLSIKAIFNFEIII